jgi:hypothetical protein
MAFDTLSYARKLKQAGVPDTQAEAMADATRDLLGSDFATKGDAAAVKSEIALLANEIAAVKREMAGFRGDMGAFRSEVGAFRSEVALKTEMAALEQRLSTAIDTMGLRLTVRMGGLIAVGVAVLAAIIKL